MAIDGPPSPTPPLTLTIKSLAVSLHPAGAAAVSRKELQYELRLTNASAKSVKMPISPNPGLTYRSCPSRQEQQVGIVLRFKKGEERAISLPGNRLWSGCPTMKDSLVTLLPGEWITYRGSAMFPPLHSDPPGLLTAAWLISDVSYSSTPEGLRENSKTKLVINSTSQKLE